MGERQSVVVTENVAELDGSKVLVIKADGKVVGVQDAEVVGERIANVSQIIADMDTALALSEADHLKAAQKRIDERIAGLVARKAALSAEGVTATAKARLQEKRLGLVTQLTALTAASKAMASRATAGSLRRN